METWVAQGRQDIDELCRIVSHVPLGPGCDRSFHVSCEVG